MTEPTDDEIDALVAAYLGDCGPQATRVYSFARAVLAKWGTSAPVGVGPAGEACAMPGTSGFTMACFHADAVPIGTKLYTTPQPTQPQAGAVPLTDEQLYEERQTAISQLFDLAQQWADNKIHSYQFGHEAEKIVDAVARRVEAAHGIKGGQHGTE